jgi:hypothetical protein
MMRSLRGRLFVALAAFILITGVIAGVVTFNWAYDEALEAQDAVLSHLPPEIACRLTSCWSSASNLKIAWWSKSYTRSTNRN